MTQPINNIIQFYNEQLEQIAEPYDRKIAELQAEQGKLVTHFPDPCESVLSGKFSAMEVSSWPQTEERFSYAYQLLSDCIDKVSSRCELAKQPTEKQIAYIIGAYKACLELKKKVLMMNADGGPPISLITDAFKAQRAALITLLQNCPQALVEELMVELDAVKRIESMESLVA
jgi:hypothetical protein